MAKGPSASLGQFEEAIEKINRGLPALPANAKEWIVKATPWIIVILSILLLPLLLAIFGVGALFGPLSFYGGYSLGFGYYLVWALTLVTFALELSAVKGLIARKKSAWNILFYVTIINAISALIQWNIGSLIISTAISLYILFQIKSYYK